MSEVKLTAYQQSLVDLSNTRTWKAFLRRWLVTTGIGLIALGVFYKGTYPALDAWVYFFALFYVVANWIGVICLGVCRILFGVIGWLNKQMEEPEEEYLPSDKAAKYHYHTRSLVTAIMRSGLFSQYRTTDPHTYFDLFVDWSLFVGLVTFGHPFLAVFHASSLALQYWLMYSLKSKLMAIILTFDDPLGADTKVDVDDLADKLFNGES